MLLKVKAVLTTIIFAILSFSDPDLNSAEKPNILMFLVDDMGTQDTSVPFYYDSSGNPVITKNNQLYHTPNMETLATTGMKFTRCYAMPVCSPTRVCIMTGKNSFRHGVTDWVKWKDCATQGGWNNSNNKVLDPPNNWAMGGIRDSEITLPAKLQRAGYYTIHAGKAHFGCLDEIGANPINIGFDVNIGGTGHGAHSYLEYADLPNLEHYANSSKQLTEALTIEMNKSIGEAVKAGKPFFAYMSHFALHSPFTFDSRVDSSRYSKLKNKKGAHKFATMIEGMDLSLGEIILRLDQLGVAEDTLVIFLGDNGSDNPHQSPNNSPPLRSKKGMKYEGGVRVPLLIAWAKSDPANKFQQNIPIPAASVQHDIVTVFDLFPTILNAAEVSFSHYIDGYDLIPYLTGKPGIHRPQELVIHYPNDHRSEFFTIFIEGNDRLIFNYEDESFELYNLAEDIGETNNLATSNSDRVNEMAIKMMQYLATAPSLWPVKESTENEVKLNLDPPPFTPRNITLTENGDSVLINWKENMELDLKSYNIYRSNKDKDKYELVANVSESQFIDNAGGTNFSYKISAVDQAGNESDHTIAFSAK